MPNRVPKNAPKMMGSCDSLDCWVINDELVGDESIEEGVVEQDDGATAPNSHGPDKHTPIADAHRPEL